MNIPNSNPQQIIIDYLNVSGEPTPQLLLDMYEIEHFQSICRKTNYPHLKLITSADQDYLNLMIYEDMSKQVNEQHLLQMVEKLEEVDYNMDCEISELQNKNKWIKTQIQSLQKDKETVEEDIEMIRHQNEKIQNEVGGSKENIVENANEEAELERLLKKYKCQGCFPKNKSQALKLLNKLEVKLHRVEVEKLTSRQQN